MAPRTSVSDIREGEFIPIPRDLLARVFRAVAYRKVGPSIEVTATLLFPPHEEWDTVVAIDASESMRPLWGKAFEGDIPLVIQERYARQGWMLEETRDGQIQRLLLPEAYDDALAKGYLKWTPNEIERPGQQFLELLAGKVDQQQQCRLMVFGAGGEPGWLNLGRVTKAEAADRPLPGDEEFEFGGEARLLPLLKHLVSEAGAVPRTLAVLVTDGRFVDANDVQSYCRNLAVLIKAKEKHFMKFLAIGVGHQVNRKVFDDMEGLEIAPGTDLWDYRPFAEINDPEDLLSTVFPVDRVVASAVVICDQSGKVVQEFPEGVLGKFSFQLPPEATGFTIQFPPDPRVIPQTLQLPFRKGVL